MFPVAAAEINLDNIKHNVSELKKLVSPKARFMAVVKADGYGHGAVAIAKKALASGADYLAVAMVSEGIKLREAGITAPILVFGWTPPENINYSLEHDLTLTVFSLRQAQYLSQISTKSGLKAKVHIKIDTGMNRLGLQVNQNSHDEIKYMTELDGLYIEGIYTHFAEADNRQSDFTRKQYAKFTFLLDNLAGEGIKFPLAHCANSAAIIDHPSTHMDMVRAGISLYGLYPHRAMQDKVLLKPAMSLKARVSHVKHIYEGETVSYGRTFTASEQKRIATIPVGYADGYSRLLSNKCKVVIRGQKVPVTGRICMDQFMVDVTGIDGEIQAGEEAILFGQASNGVQVSVDDIADIIGTINYEVVCMVGKRIPRIYIERIKNSNL